MVISPVDTQTECLNESETLTFRLLLMNFLTLVFQVTMATGGVRRIYEEDDPVDDSLLNQLSKWILYDRLPSLARDLGMSQADFSRIAIATTQPQEQIFKVSFFHPLSLFWISNEKINFFSNMFNFIL